MTDTSIPGELSYTPEHEWVLKISDNKIRVGITDYAQKQLGDIVYVGLPEEEATYTTGDSFAEVESTKSVSDIYSPLGGKVVTVNTELESSPELINSDPYGEGWIADFVVDEENLAEFLEEALDSEGYKAII